MTNIKEEIEKIHKQIHQVILSSKFNKYKIVPYIARWAAELKYKEEYKDLLDSERINIAIYDVLTGRISIEDIKKLPPLEARKKLSILKTAVEEKLDIEKKENNKKKK